MKLYEAQEALQNERPELQSGMILIKIEMQT